MNEPELVNAHTGPVVPVALNLEVGDGQIEIRTDATRPAAVAAEPLVPDDQVALGLIRRAIVIETSDRLDVRFPDPPPVSVGGGSISIGDITRGVMFVNGTTVIGGVRASDGSLNVTAIVPPGSTITIRTKSASAKIFATRDGERGVIPSIDFHSVSGDLYASGVENINARSTSGDIEADGAAGVMAASTSGDIEMSGLRGNASLNSVSGDIEAHCTLPITVTAQSVSGDIRVTSAPSVNPRVTARSVSGKVRTP